MQNPLDMRHWGRKFGLWPGNVRQPAQRPHQADTAASSQAFTVGEGELQVALAHMDELDSRSLTRIACVYELSGRAITVADGKESLAGVYDFGQFKDHIKIAAELLPEPIASRSDLEVGPHGMFRLEFVKAKACLLRTPRGDTALVLDGLVSGDLGSQRVAEILAFTCAERDKITIEGMPLLDWLRAQIRADGHALPESLSFGQNVHQCVFPGGKLLGGIRAGESFWRIINRVAAPIEPAVQIATFRPPELNYAGITAVGHGRGVSVMAGFSEEVENTYLLTAVMLITGLSVLHRSRERLFSAMTEASNTPPNSSEIGRASCRERV